MYFNQGLLGPDPEPNLALELDPAPEPDPAPKLDLAPERDPASELEIASHLDPSHFFNCHSRPTSYLRARWHFSVHSDIFHLNKATSTPITLRTKSPHFSKAAFSPFILLPFLQELKTKKEKNGKIISFLIMINETCVRNLDPKIPHNTD
jgi:hypothetical protein